MNIKFCNARGRFFFVLPLSSVISFFPLHTTTYVQNCHRYSTNFGNFMWVCHHTTNAPDLGFWGVSLKYLLSPRPSVRVGCCRLGPCEKSNMFDISHDYNRFIFPAVNKMSSPRHPQASSDPNLHSRVLSQAACDP